MYGYNGSMLQCMGITYVLVAAASMYGYDALVAAASMYGYDGPIII